MDFGSLTNQFLDHIERRGKANVVCVGFERQPQNRHPFTFDYPKCLANLIEEAFDSLFVDALGRFQNVEINPHRSRQMDESLHILGEAEATEAQSRPKKLPADPRI